MLFKASIHFISILRKSCSKKKWKSVLGINKTKYWNSKNFDINFVDYLQIGINDAIMRLKMAFELPFRRLIKISEIRYEIY